MQSNVFPYFFFFCHVTNFLFINHENKIVSQRRLLQKISSFLSRLYSVFKHTDIKNRDIKVLLLIACASFMSFIVPPSNTGFKKVLSFQKLLFKSHAKENCEYITFYHFKCSTRCFSSFKKKKDWSAC